MRLKKLDKLMVASFWPPFIATFFIALFVLVMQSLFLVLDDIAGKGVANPIATILSFSMALKYSLNLDKESKELDAAVQKILDDGLRTKDICSKGNKEVSTKDVGDAIIACLQN